VNALRQSGEREKSYPATVLQFFARCSAPRSDRAKIVYVGFEAPAVAKMPGPAQ